MGVRKITRLGIPTLCLSVLAFVLSLLPRSVNSQSSDYVIQSGGAQLVSIAVEQQTDVSYNSDISKVVVSPPVPVTSLEFEGSSGDTGQYKFSGTGGFEGNGADYYADQGSVTYRYPLTMEACAYKKGGFVKITTYELYDTQEPYAKDVLAQIGLNEPLAPSGGTKKKRSSGLSSESVVEIHGDIHRDNIEATAASSGAILDARKRKRSGQAGEGGETAVVVRVIPVGVEDPSRSSGKRENSKLKNAKRDFRLGFFSSATGEELPATHPEVVSLLADAEDLRKAKRGQGGGGGGAGGGTPGEGGRSKRSYQPYQSYNGWYNNGADNGYIQGEDTFNGIGTSNPGIACNTATSGTTMTSSCQVDAIGVLVPSPYASASQISSLAAAQVSQDSAISDLNSAITQIGNQMGMVQDQISILAQTQVQNQYQFKSILTMVGQQGSATALLGIQTNYLGVSVQELGATMNANFQNMATTVSGVTQLVGSQINSVENQMYALQTRMQSEIDGAIVQSYSEMATMYVQLMNQISALKLDGDMVNAQMVDNINSILKGIQTKTDRTDGQVQQHNSLLLSVINSLTDLFQHNFGTGDLGSIYFAHKGSVEAAGYIPVVRSDGVPNQNMSMSTARDGRTLTFTSFQCTSPNQQDLIDANTQALGTVQQILYNHAIFSLTIPLSIHPDYLLSIGNIHTSRTDVYAFPFFFITAYLITGSSGTTQTLTPAVLSTTPATAYVTGGQTYLQVQAFPATLITDTVALEFFIVNTAIQEDTSGVVRDGDVFQIRAFLYTSVYTLCPDYGTANPSAGYYTLRLMQNAPLDNSTCQWWIRNINYTNPDYESQDYLTQQPFNHESSIAFIPYTGPTQQNVNTPPEGFMPMANFTPASTGLSTTLKVAEYSIYRTPPSGALRPLQGDTEITYAELTAIEATRVRRKRWETAEMGADGQTVSFTRSIQKHPSSPRTAMPSSRRPDLVTKEQVVKMIRMGADHEEEERNKKSRPSSQQGGGKNRYQHGRKQSASAELAGKLARVSSEDDATNPHRPPRPTRSVHDTKKRRPTDDTPTATSSKRSAASSPPHLNRGRRSPASGTMDSCFSGFVHNGGAYNFATTGYSGVQNSDVANQTALLNACNLKPGCSYVQITEPKTINVYASPDLTGTPANLGATFGTNTFTGSWVAAVVPGSMTLQLTANFNYTCQTLSGGSCRYSFPVEHIDTSSYYGSTPCQNDQCYCGVTDTNCQGGSKNHNGLGSLSSLASICSILIGQCTWDQGVLQSTSSIPFTATNTDWLLAKTTNTQTVGGLCSTGLYEKFSPWCSGVIASNPRPGFSVCPSDGSSCAATECNFDSVTTLQSYFCSVSGTAAGYAGQSTPGPSNMWESSVVSLSTCTKCYPGTAPNPAINPATAGAGAQWCLPTNPSAPTTTGGDPTKVSTFNSTYVLTNSFEILFTLGYTGAQAPGGPGYYSGCLPTSLTSSGGVTFADGTTPMPLPFTTPYLFAPGDAGPSGFTFQASSTTFVTSFPACSGLPISSCLSVSIGNANILSSTKYGGLCSWGVDTSAVNASTPFSPSFACSKVSDNRCNAAGPQGAVGACLAVNFTNGLGQAVPLCVWDTLQPAGQNCQPFIGMSNIVYTDTYPTSVGSPNTTVVYLPCYLRAVQSGNAFRCTFDGRCYAAVNSNSGGGVGTCQPIANLGPLVAPTWSVTTNAAALATFYAIGFGNSTGSIAPVADPVLFATQCLATALCIVDGSTGPGNFASSEINIRVNQLMNFLSPGAVACSSLSISNGECTYTLLEQQLGLAPSLYEYPSDSILSLCEVFTTACQPKCSLYGSNLDACLNSQSNCMIDGLALTCLSNTLANTDAICPGFISSTFELGSRCVGSVNLCTLLLANQTLTGAPSSANNTQNSECSQLANYLTGNMALNSTRLAAAGVVLPSELQNACIVVQQYGNLTCEPENLNPGCTLENGNTFCNKDADPFLIIDSTLQQKNCLYTTIGECLGSSGTQVCSWIEAPTGYSQCTTASNGARIETTYGSQLKVYTSASFAASNRVVAALYQSSLANLQALYGNAYASLNISEGSSSSVDPNVQVVLLGPPTIPCSGGPGGGDPSLDVPYGYMCCVAGACDSDWHIYYNEFHPKIAYISALQTGSTGQLCQGVETYYETAISTACKIYTINGTDKYVCEAFAGPNTGGSAFFDLSSDTSGRPEQPVVFTSATPPRMLTPLFTDPSSNQSAYTWRTMASDRRVQFNGTQYQFDLIYNITAASLSQIGAALFTDVNVTQEQSRVASTGDTLFSSQVLASRDIQAVINSDISLFVSTATVFTGSKIQNAGVREDSGVERFDVGSSTSPVSGKASTKANGLIMAYTSPQAEVPIYLYGAPLISYSGTLQQFNGTNGNVTLVPVSTQVTNPYEHLLPKPGQQVIMYEDSQYLYSLSDRYIGIGIEGPNLVGYISEPTCATSANPTNFLNANQAWFVASSANTYPSQYAVPRVPYSDPTSPFRYCGNTLQGTGQGSTAIASQNATLVAQILNVETILAFSGTIAATQNITASQQNAWAIDIVNYGLDAVELFLQTVQGMWKSQGCTQVFVNFIQEDEPLYDIARIFWMGAVNASSSTFSISTGALAGMISPIARAANRIQCGNCALSFDSAGNALPSDGTPGVCDPVYGTQPPGAYQPVKTLNAVMTTELPFCTLSSYFVINWQPDLGYVEFTLRPGFGTILNRYRLLGEIDIVATSNMVNVCPVPVAANGTAEGDIVAEAFSLTLINAFPNTIIYTVRSRDTLSDLFQPYNSTLAPTQSACYKDYLRSIGPKATEVVNIPICSGTFFIQIYSQDGVECPSPYFTGGIDYTAILRNDSSNLQTFYSEYNSSAVANIQALIEQSQANQQNIQNLQNSLSDVTLQLQQNRYVDQLSLANMSNSIDEFYQKINNQSNVIYAINTTINEGVHVVLQSYNQSFTAFVGSQAEINTLLNLTSQQISSALGTISQQIQTVGGVEALAYNISQTQAIIQELQRNATAAIAQSEEQTAAAQAAAAAAIVNVLPAVYNQSPVGRNAINSSINQWTAIAIIGALLAVLLVLVFYLLVKQCTAKKDPSHVD